MLFQDKKSNVRHMFQELEEILLPFGYEQRITASLERLEREVMNLLVVGEFSRGKSTFINALLGQPVLPSKVNPTTATINIIKSGSERKMMIQDREGQLVEHALPSEQINKFLNDFVTVSNKEANNIKQITITIPSALDAWHCNIVDTPGVNDLDDVREEVTYSYLRNADACIVLLDSQQPLSESERRFINDKVLANDIHRIVFVINRIDEVESQPGGPNAIRIQEHVKKLIQEKITMPHDPILFTLSAKEALRSKYKQQDNGWGSLFREFEQFLQQFMSRLANKNRLEEHVDRALGIAYSGVRTMQDRIELLHLSEAEIDSQKRRLEMEERRLQIKLQGLALTIDRETLVLSRQLQDQVEKRFTALKETLLVQADQCTGEADLQSLKSTLSTGVRDITDSVLSIITNHKQTLFRKLKQEFAELFTLDPASLSLAQRDGLAKGSTISVDSFHINLPTTDDDSASVLLKSAAAGGVITLIAASLLGPIGVVGGIIGSFILGGKMEEDSQKKQLELMLIEMKRDLRHEINQSIQTSMDQIATMAKQELLSVELYYREHIEGRLASISETLTAQQNAVHHQSQDVQSQLQDLQQRIAHIHRMMEQLHLLRGAQ